MSNKSILNEQWLIQYLNKSQDKIIILMPDGVYSYGINDLRENIQHIKQLEQALYEIINVCRKENHGLTPVDCVAGFEKIENIAKQAREKNE